MVNHILEYKVPDPTGHLIISYELQLFTRQLSALLVSIDIRVIFNPADGTVLCEALRVCGLLRHRKILG
jgi:hypothetical protein